MLFSQRGIVFSASRQSQEEDFRFDQRHVMSAHFLLLVACRQNDRIGNSLGFGVFSHGGNDLVRQRQRRHESMSMGKLQDQGIHCRKIYVIVRKLLEILLGAQIVSIVWQKRRAILVGGQHRLTTRHSLVSSQNSSRPPLSSPSHKHGVVQIQLIRNSLEFLDVLRFLLFPVFALAFENFFSNRPRQAKAGGVIAIRVFVTKIATREDTVCGFNTHQTSRCHEAIRQDRNHDRGDDNELLSLGRVVGRLSHGHFMVIEHHLGKRRGLGL
mmetsp:Transcript_78497/g.118038  ORF Transcript_78497/g.118038 Transcript_78497/m.118038 type:complete len:269 (+) Transcript_78497:255-1061(+)